MKFYLIEEDEPHVPKADAIRMIAAFRVNPQKRQIIDPVAEKIYNAIPDLIETPDLYELPMDEFKYVVNLANILSSPQNQVNYFGQRLSAKDLANIFFTNKYSSESTLRDTGLHDHEDSDTMWAQVEYLSKPEGQNNPTADQLNYMFKRDLQRYDQLIRKYGEYTDEQIAHVLNTQLDSNKVEKLDEKEKQLFILLYDAFQQDTLFRKNLRVFLCNYAYDLIVRHELMDTEINKIIKGTHDKNAPWLKYIR